MGGQFHHVFLMLSGHDHLYSGLCNMPLEADEFYANIQKDPDRALEIRKRDTLIGSSSYAEHFFIVFCNKYFVFHARKVGIP